MAQVLKQRLLTAGILGPLFIWGVLSLSVEHFAILIGVFVVLGSWEWSGLMQMTKLSLRILYSVLTVLPIGLMMWIDVPLSSLANMVIVTSLGWWIIAFVMVMRYPAYNQLWGKAAKLSVIGWLVLIPTWTSLVALKSIGQNGGYWVLILFVLIWSADTGAYFAGRKWGKTKLAPAVSPGKTWEGVAGGIALVAVCLAIVLAFMSSDQRQGLSIGALIVLALVTVVFSVLGDLTESMVKRHANRKDSGTLLPGHGGVLDRIDSVTAAAPVFAYGLYWVLDISLDLAL